MCAGERRSRGRKSLRSDGRRNAVPVYDEVSQGLNRSAPHRLGKNPVGPRGWHPDVRDVDPVDVTRVPAGDADSFEDRGGPIERPLVQSSGQPYPRSRALDRRTVRRYDQEGVTNRAGCEVGRAGNDGDVRPWGVCKSVQSFRRGAR